MRAFHAYDIRGIYNVEFNQEDVYKIGRTLPEILHTKKVLVGRDVRLSSPEIFAALSKGITDSGADVYNAGLATTPFIYWSTARFGFDASVMITASHNPKEYNGMKISRTDALPVGYDSGLRELENKIAQNLPKVSSGKKGRIVDYDVKQDYLDFLKNYLADITNLKITIDCSNGMAGIFIKDLFHNEPVYINDKPDGTFPGHEPNPLEPKNIKQLQEKVIAEKSDIGVIYDGDADRVMFVDEKGNFVPPDLIIALLAHYFFEEKGLTGNVLQDIRTSKSVGEYILKFGGKIHMWRVGRAYASVKLREIDGIYGGELAGHYYFRDFYYSDSGILASLLVLRILGKFKKQGISFSDIINTIRKYSNSGEINFKINDKTGAISELKEFFIKEEKPTAIFDFDGYRIEFNDWWFNIRPSNTEPLLRLIAEAKNPELLNEKVSTIKTILHKFE